MKGLPYCTALALGLAAGGCQSPHHMGAGGSGGTDVTSTLASTTGSPTSVSTTASASGSTSSQSSSGSSMMCNVDGTIGPCCSVDGNIGVCIDTSMCPSDGDHTSVAGYCPGAANIECCVDTPTTADNPPVPTGWVLMMQSDVTPEMTSWAVMILNDPTDYPMYSTAMQTFSTSSGMLLVMARVEWHPPDFQNGAIHRGVTLYKQGTGG